MSLKDPEVILREFNAVIEKLRQAKAPLSPADQRAMADELTDTYNYVSGSSRKRSLQNYIYSQSAHDARVKEQLEEERKQMELHKSFVESSFDKADQYLRTIQLGGYAAFFAVWGMTREWLTPFWGVLAAILMIVSATIFVIWEIWKSTLLSLVLKHHASIGSSSIEGFIRTRMSKLILERSKITKLAQARASVWIACVVPAVLSLVILVWRLLKVLSQHLTS